MKAAVLMVAAVALLTACNNKMEPNARNFGEAIDAHLVENGWVCLANQVWPVEWNEQEKSRQAAARTDFPVAGMEALISLGLVSSAEAERPVRSFFGSDERSEKVTRYAITDKGRPYFKQRSGIYAALGGKGENGALCYARLAVDKIIKWEGPIKLGDYQEATVHYQDKVVDVAEWARLESIQAVFPDVKAELDAGERKPRQRSVHLSSIGWEASNGLY